MHTCGVQLWQLDGGASVSVEEGGGGNGVRSSGSWSAKKQTKKASKRNVLVSA